MNHAKIAAALHALADAFLPPFADAESVEEVVTAKKGKKAAAAPATAAVTQVATTATAAPVAVPTVAPATEPATPPPPTITKEQLNKAVLKVAAKSREAAVAILSKFEITNTVNLAEEKWQAVYDAFEEEIAKIDAAAVQVAQASLV
jgi:hypothetical protein